MMDMAMVRRYLGRHGVQDVLAEKAIADLEYLPPEAFLNWRELTERLMRTGFAMDRATLFAMDLCDIAILLRREYEKGLEAANQKS